MKITFNSYFTIFIHFFCQLRAISALFPLSLTDRLRSENSFDLKKRVLTDQLLRLVMLSNATARMTDKVNDILIRRMKSEKNEKRNDDEFRVINWNIENQGKQTIIIL